MRFRPGAGARGALGEPEEIAVGLPKLDAIAISGGRIYLIADHRLVAWLPRS